jgi:photosystem II stability/assembly factor-like uncharacterized protein
MVMRQDVPSRLLAIFLVLGAALCVVPPARAGVNWWTPTGPEGGLIFDLEVDPQTRTVYAGTAGGVFASTNGGTSWVRRNRGLGAYGGLLAHSATPAPALYTVGREGVIYRSLDGGLSWIPGGRPGFDQVYSLVADPSDASVLYAGTSFNGIYKSSNGGATWDQVLDGSCQLILSMAIDPRDPSTVYVACGTSAVPFFKTTDGGATWTPQGTRPPIESSELTLVLDPDRPGVVYLTAKVFLNEGYSLTTFKSSDDGATWTRFGPDDGFILPSPPGLLFLGKHRSTDGGNTWQELPLPAAPTVLDFAPGDPATLYAGIPAFGVYKSTDAGVTWKVVNRGLAATTIQGLEISPESTLYALVDGLGLQKGVRGGRRWQRADAGLAIPAFLTPFLDHPLVIDPQEPSNLYFGSSEGLARSTDGGASWTVVNECLVSRFLTIDPRNPDWLYALRSFHSSCGAPYNNCEVLRSSDAGATWACIAPSQLYLTVEELVVDPVEPSRIYAVRPLKDNIWVSHNRGNTWSRLRLPRFIGLRTLTVDPKDSRKLYVGTSSGLVYKSTDRGATWSESSSGLPTGGFQSILQIVIDPQRSQTVYVVHTEGVFVSGNGGRTWHPLNGGLPTAPVRLVLDPQNPRKLYAATRGNGVYVHERR